jgi:hypothetical protein
MRDIIFEVALPTLGMVIGLAGVILAVELMFY